VARDPRLDWRQYALFLVLHSGQGPLLRRPLLTGFLRLGVEVQGLNPLRGYVKRQLTEALPLNCANVEFCREYWMASWHGQLPELLVPATRSSC